MRRALAIVLGLALSACAAGTPRALQDASGLPSASGSTSEPGLSTESGTASPAATWCEQWAIVQAKIDGAAQALLGEDASPFPPEQVRSAFVAMQGAVGAAGRIAPSEITDDVAVLARATARLFAAAERAGWDPGRVPQGEKDAFNDDPDVEDAGNRILAYNETACGATPAAT